MVELRTLGSVRLTSPGGPESRHMLRQPKRLALLCYLAVAPGFVRRDSLVALFWPERDHVRARAALRQSAHVLRAMLGDAVLLGRRDEELGVAPDQLWCDVREFERLIGAAQFADALSLYRGHFLDGFYLSGTPGFEEWVENTRARLLARARAAAWELAEARAEDAPEYASHWARWAVALEPDDERAIRRLIVVLDRVGDRIGAVRAYQQFARRAALDFGVEPSAETQRLMRRIMAGGNSGPSLDGASAVATTATGRNGGDPAARLERQQM